MAKAGRPRRVSCDEAGEVAAGADVDEDPQAVGVHGLDRLAERHRARPLGDRQLADRFGVGGHPPAGGARVDRDRRGRKRQAGEERRRSARAPRRTPACGRPGRTAGPPAGCSPRAGDPDDPVDLRRRPGQDDLVRAVVDRDGDLVRHRRPGRPPRRGRRSAATATSRAAGTSAGRLQAAEDRAQPAELPLELPVRPQHARRRQGQELAAAVAGHRVGLQAEPGQHLVERPLRRSGPRSPPSAPTRARPRPRRSTRGRTGARSAAPRHPARARCDRPCRTAGGPRGSARQRSASIPGYCDPSPGNRNARPPGPPRGSSQ